jgi:hypothetical protein
MGDFRRFGYEVAPQGGGEGGLSEVFGYVEVGLHPPSAPTYWRPCIGADYWWSSFFFRAFVDIR